MLRLEPWLSRLQIVSKRADIEGSRIRQLDISQHEPYKDFAWAQHQLVREVERQYNEGKPVRIIVLKARQLGTSTISAGVGFLWSFFHPNTQGLIVAHENRTARKLFRMTKFFWDSCPWQERFEAKHQTQQSLMWAPPIGSGIDIASAQNLGAGRGDTISMLHVSEAAFYPDAETLMMGLRNTTPNEHQTLEIVESTANGIGNWFHGEWNLAIEGKSDYVPMFFPWFFHYEYLMHTSIKSDLELDEEEQYLRSLGATYEGIEWRRWMIPNRCHGDEDFFRQEYPATAEEAFITSGRNIFNLKKLSECYEPLDGQRGRLVSTDGFNPKWIPDSYGPLTVYKAPSKTRKRPDLYEIAGDPSRTTTGDPACIQVLSRDNYEQVAVYHDRIDPEAFAHEMMLLGRWYHDAQLCPEVEGGGQATIGIIKDRGYPNIYRWRRADTTRETGTLYGFSTNYKTKSWAIGRLQHLILEKAVTIHDATTFHQLQEYIQTSAYGDMGPASNDGHDDAVMALAISVFASLMEPPYQIDPPVQQQPEDIYAVQGR